MDERFPKKEREDGGGWSQFIAWAGMTWFTGPKPITPPKERDGKHPITCCCSNCK